MKKNERVVVTNDDGFRSPLLEAFLQQLAAEPWCESVRPVVPKEEQSWAAQAVTRFRHVDVERREVGGQPGFVVTGTPADCASLGITDLYPDRPTLLLSGINFGTNENLAFYLNSGTVGGARQGIVFGCRAVAVSLKMPSDLFQMWRRLDIDGIAARRDDWVRVSKAACRIISLLLEDDCWEGVDLFTINMPWEVTEETPLCLTRLERVTYPSIFHSFEEGVFRHRLEALQRADATSSPVSAVGDIAAIGMGSVSVSPIVYDLFPRDPRLIETLTAKLTPKS